MRNRTHSLQCPLHLTGIKIVHRSSPRRSIPAIIIVLIPVRCMPCLFGPHRRNMVGLILPGSMRYRRRFLAPMRSRRRRRCRFRSGGGPACPSSGGQRELLRPRLLRSLAEPIVSRDRCQPDVPVPEQILPESQAEEEKQEAPYCEVDENDSRDILQATLTESNVEKRECFQDSVLCLVGIRRNCSKHGSMSQFPEDSGVALTAFHVNRICIRFGCEAFDARILGIRRGQECPKSCQGLSGANETLKYGTYQAKMFPRDPDKLAQF